MLEAIRISCAGYPTKRTFDEFIDRFGMLAPDLIDRYKSSLKSEISLFIRSIEMNTDEYLHTLKGFMFDSYVALTRRQHVRPYVIEWA